jgi:hypothetical protein
MPRLFVFNGKSGLFFSSFRPGSAPSSRARLPPITPGNNPEALYYQAPAGGCLCRSSHWPADARMPLNGPTPPLTKPHPRCLKHTQHPPSVLDCHENGPPGSPLPGSELFLPLQLPPWPVGVRLFFNEEIPPTDKTTQGA